MCIIYIIYISAYSSSMNVEYTQQEDLLCAKTEW